MSDSDLDKEVVYLAYRNIFKGQLAKLRKLRRVRNVVEKHKDHLHYKQFADSMGSEKACKILGDLLAGGLFESDSAAEAPLTTQSTRNGVGRYSRHFKSTGSSRMDGL